MKNDDRVIVTASLIAGSNFLGNVAAPSSILLTPIVILISSFLLLRAEMKLYYRVFLIIAAIVINDIFIKLFAGGTHDLPGAGWINLFLIFGLVIATTLTFIELKFTQKYPLFKAMVFTLLIPSTVLLYLNYFGLFGLVYSEPVSDSETISKEKGAFVGKLQFSNNIIAHSSDSIILVNGWSERERRIDHRGLLQKKEYSDNVHFIIRTHHNMKSHHDAFYYQVNSKDINGSSPVDSTIQFSLPKSDSLIYLTFFKIGGSVSNDSIIKQVKINIQ